MESIVVTCCTTLSRGSSSDESGWPISTMRCSTRSLISKSVERSWRSSALRMVLGINKISYVTMLICLLLDYIRTVQSRNFSSCPGIYQALLMLSYWGLHHEDTKAQRSSSAPLRHVAEFGSIVVVRLFFVSWCLCGEISSFNSTPLIAPGMPLLLAQKISGL